jgi:hypothetical protein
MPFPVEPPELPMRVVGKRVKTIEERFAEIQRLGRHFRRRRQAKVELLRPDGTWVPYVRSQPAGTT